MRKNSSVALKLIEDILRNKRPLSEESISQWLEENNFIYKKNRNFETFHSAFKRGMQIAKQTPNEKEITIFNELRYEISNVRLTGKTNTKAPKGDK